MKRFLIVASASVIVIGVSGCGVSKPGSVESRVAKEIKSNVTVGGKDDKNPIAYSDNAVKEGGEHFQHHCQICHGLDGQNTGVPFSQQMSPPVPDLTSKDVQDYKDGQLKWIIQNGIGPSGMPAWKGILDDDEMWKIVHYIRHLPPKGSLGAPAIFKEEEEEHKEMNGESKPHEHHHH
jgi:mono/diheme cytochrome c family protein